MSGLSRNWRRRSFGRLLGRKGGAKPILHGGGDEIPGLRSACETVDAPFAAEGEANAPAVQRLQRLIWGDRFGVFRTFSDEVGRSALHPTGMTGVSVSWLTGPGRPVQ